MKNPQAVFTMNPSGGGLRDRASSSLALFNRCVLNWFVDWADTTLYEVKHWYYILRNKMKTLEFGLNAKSPKITISLFKVRSELTTTVDMDRKDCDPPFALPKVCDLTPGPTELSSLCR
uniref:Uncharacterized protein n=1 Tax=Angiostrongylus cantonensis TaxID=6313 RepID=A0A0K0D8M7_ANGCA